jgi:serine/threonine protein kinase
VSLRSPLSFPLCLCDAQGGLTLAQVLSILRQVVAGLMHLHSLGILHRDLRAANLLIDSLDPLRILVADFGVSHLLSAFAAGARAMDLSASKVPSLLTGPAALGPLQVRCLIPGCWGVLLSQAEQMGAG